MSFHRDIRGPALHAPSNEKIENHSGSTIQKLQVVALDGSGTMFPQVVLANPNTLTNFGIAMQELKDGDTGYVTTIGFMLNIDTSAWNENDILYSDVNGDLTTTILGAPVAIVNKVDASCGALYVVALSAAFGGNGVGLPWLINGNNGTDPATHFLGTTDEAGVTLRTNDIQRQRVDEQGRFLFGDAGEVTPKYFMHVKQHSGYNGSGNMKETAAITVADTTVTNIYSFVIPNYSTVMATIRIVALEEGNTEQATFIRSGTWFREGGTAQQMGILQSDYTNKSNLDFDLQFSKTGTTVFVNVKNANAKATRWQITIELDIMLNDAP